MKKAKNLGVSTEIEKGQTSLFGKRNHKTFHTII